MKRYVFFIDAFPDSAAYEALPMDIFATAARAVSKTGCYDVKAARARAAGEFNVEWSSSVSCSQLPVQL